MKSHSEFALTVHSVIDPGVEFIDLSTQIIRIQINICLLRRQKTVELRVKDPNDLRAFVVHNGLGLLIPEYRDGESGGGQSEYGRPWHAEECVTFPSTTDLL